MTLWWNSRPIITFDKSTLWDDLDGYLAASESKVANIRPGLQKHIVWNNPARKTKTPYAIIYLHGFSASSGEIRPVPDLVAKHLGANLYLARQTGHGTDGEALGRATLVDWVNDVAEAIAIGERIGDRVIVMATSTGAALATWVVTEPALAKKIDAAILLSPNYRLRARGAFLLSAPFARQIVHTVLGRTRSFAPINDEHSRIWTYRYPTDALLPLAEAMRLANGSPVEKTKVPALFLYSPADTVIDPAAIDLIAERWGAPHKLIPVNDADDPSAHVIAGDALSPSTTHKVAAEIGNWLEEVLPGRTTNA